jgi:hypothetical protein
MTRIQGKLLQTITDAIFKLKLRPIYEKVNFLDLNMDTALTESLKIFEDYSVKMSKSTSRQAWTAFLE